MPFVRRDLPFLLQGHPASVCLSAALLLVGCTGTAGTAPPAPSAAASPSAVAPAPASQGTTFTDPFAYCAAVETTDAPDNRYVGEKVPESIARGLQRAFGAPADAPLEPFLRSSFWRCGGGKVYACTDGANLPCQTKADLGRQPTAGVVQFCQQNNDAANIPAVATGRATVYQWRCAATAPEIVRQLVEPDERGFLANIWLRALAWVGRGQARRPAPQTEPDGL